MWISIPHDQGYYGFADSAGGNGKKMKIDPKTFSVPDTPYIPGKGERPAHDFMGEIAQQAPAVTENSSAAGNLPWLYGIALFNKGFYWEAHEVWEPVWMRALPNSREKHLVQGAIHLTNAALKKTMGLPQASRRLAKLADESFARAFVKNDTQTGNILMGLSRDNLLQIKRSIDTADIDIINMNYNA